MQGCADMRDHENVCVCVCVCVCVEACAGMRDSTDMDTDRVNDGYRQS